MPKQPIKVNQLLLQQRGINQLLQKKIQHETVLNIVRQVLPPAIRQHCLSCVTQGNQLTLYAKTAAWAAQIRYYEPVMLEHLNGSPHAGFGKIQIRIQPSIQQASINPRQVSRPSTTTISAIQACALSYPPGKLKQSLLRLVHALKRGSDLDLS